MILREAVERAGTIDRAKVNEAIRALDLREGPAATSFAGQRMAFHENGRRIGAPLVIVQWQNGVPVSVFPAATAMASVNWPRR